LSADDVDRWLLNRAKLLSTDTLRQLRSILKRAVTRAQAGDKVKRNVVLLCEVPKGQAGRRSKSLTFTQARRWSQRRRTPRCTPTSFCRS
jgi:hypothetical protein